MKQQGQFWTYALCAVMMITTPVVVMAQDEADEADGPWSGTGELGFVLSRGNSDTETLNANAEVVYDPDRWKHQFRVEWLRASNDGDTTAKRFTAALNSDYELDQRSYLFGALRYDDDEFSGFNYQGTIALGYGRILIDNDRHHLTVEAGPGLRISEPVDTGETETDLIARGQVDYKWTLSDNANLTNQFLIESGSDNTFFENKLALNTGITDTLGLKLGVSVRRNSNVPVGRKQTDYLTTANLVYQFL
ncbi:MAG: hypothetical protein Tsb002_14230 [Wenzhouxiangellaceae bacterium]